MRCRSIFRQARRRRARGDSFATRATSSPEKVSSAARLPRARGRPRQSKASRKAWRIGGIGMLAAVGLLLGACGGSSLGSARTTSTARSVAALDPCLVGTWIDRGESDALSYKGTPVVMDGLAGKTVTISPGGTETVGFARAAPLRGSLGTSTYTVTESGTITDHVRSSAGALTVSNLSYTGLSETAALGEATASPPELLPPTPDHYTCSATTMSLSGARLHATFSRSSSSPAPSAASSIPDLFVYTAAIPPPGELFAWPKFPTKIQQDDNDWISGITWSARPQSASGSGTFYTDLSCSGPAAGCPPVAEGTVELSATLPETCTVTFADPSTGAQGGAIGLTNLGPVTCTLFGYPGMQLFGTGGHPLPGEQLPTTVIRGQYQVVDVVPEQLVTLAPGARARFYYMYSDTLGGGSPAVCPTASAIDITPPGAYHQLTVVTDIAPCEGHIWVSPVTTLLPYPLVNGSF